MYKHSELSFMGAKNLCSYLKNYIDYDKLGIDTDKYINRLEYLYGWLYAKAALKDEVMVNIAFIESHLFNLFSVEELLNDYENYNHLLWEFEEISYKLSEETFKNDSRFEIVPYLVTFFDKLVLVGGYKNRYFNSDLIVDIVKDLWYSFDKMGERSYRYYTRIRYSKGIIR